MTSLGLLTILHFFSRHRLLKTLMWTFSTSAFDRNEENVTQWSMANDIPGHACILKTTRIVRDTLENPSLNKILKYHQNNAQN